MRCRGLPRRAVLAVLSLLAAGTGIPAQEGKSSLPVRGLHVSAPSKRDLPDLLAFVREALPREGVNTLIIEFGWRFD